MGKTKTKPFGELADRMFMSTFRERETHGKHKGNTGKGKQLMGGKNHHWRANYFVTFYVFHVFHSKLNTPNFAPTLLCQIRTPKEQSTAVAEQFNMRVLCSSPVA